MAFAYTVNRQFTAGGGAKVVTGTYTSSGGSTGGDIDTSLRTCYFIQLQPKSAAVVADQPAINETLPVSGKAITIVTTANETGYWIATGI